ncbi:hypothetical protein [Desulfoferrobacter suflitae]|uniref:hypothetical protein n=1 Tax=Desulfoferrobacter suflitae TaxID=2865782 RepID=UPI00338DFDD3
MDDKNYPLSTIQSLLRHKSANTTSKYIHKLRGFRAVLDEAFRREPPPPVAAPEVRELPEPKPAPAQNEESHSQVGASTKGRPYPRLVRFR